jgi:hypothetical protein
MTFINPNLPFVLQGNGEDVFKMGRSTGRLFKEKGVSLYKDREISTTHAKVARLPHMLLRRVFSSRSNSWFPLPV